MRTMKGRVCSLVEHRHFECERINWTKLHGYNFTNNDLHLWLITFPMYIQYLGNSFELEVLLSERGTLENSELKCSEFWKYPPGGGLGFLGDEFIDKADTVPVVSFWLENGGTEVVFGLVLCESSVGFPVIPAESLFSLSSDSLSRKSTHISVNDWKKGKEYIRAKFKIWNEILTSIKHGRFSNVKKQPPLVWDWVKQLTPMRRSDSSNSKLFRNLVPTCSILIKYTRITY